MTTIRLHESNDKMDASSKGEGIYRVRIIDTGWGSSGYYSEKVLAEYGPKTFTKGTGMYLNHSTEQEVANGRDLEKIAAKLITDAEFDESEGALFADIKVGSRYRDIIEEYQEIVGLSIFASGDVSEGEAEGRSGKIVESFNIEDPYKSVDFVVAAGRGGRIEKMIESATADNSKGKSMTEEDVTKLVTALSTALSTAVAEAVGKEIEQRLPVVEKEEVEPLNKAEVAEKLVAEGILPSQRKSIYALIDTGITQEELDTVIEEAKKDVEELQKSLVESSAPYGAVRTSESSASDYTIKAWS